eukprot:CAMPEP_0202940570 /NCGR_PEP_ID=MMETSP1395-20130829/702_1 /ASSEMBLY_ACC=CAM_ASM_000871 /TAXON_ID=5961 /ORGANISM="Blepharisma japonicum, Strain Stock R1072" /LENGTH=87 /DNA_ID=CAMNT_0049635123 /DNA_START=482 /DNA_END=745 /DNA_ORIENTATION=+
MSGLGGVVMQGMAFGAGSEIAHTAVRGLMGGSGSEAHEQQQVAPQQPVQDMCSQQNQDFLNCLQYNNNNIGACQNYLDLFKQCKGQY